MQPKDFLEAVGHLNSLYSSMFNTLIAIVTIALAVVGVGLPMLISWYQNRRLQLETDAIHARLLAALKKELEPLVETKTLSLRQEVHRLSRENSGAICHAQGLSAGADGRIIDAIVNFCIAVYCYLDCENHLNAQRALAELKRHAASTKSTELIVGPGESRDIQKLIEVMRIYNEQHGQIYLDSYNELLQYKSNLVQHPLPIEELGDLVVGFRPA